MTALLPGARAIFELVERTRHWLRVATVSTGACATVGVLLGTVVLALIVDWLFPLGVVGRVVALGVVLVGTIGTYAWAVVRPAAQPMSLSVVACRMERGLPGIRNRLVSCVELLDVAPPLAAGPTGGAAAFRSGAAYSLAFEQRLIAETTARLGEFQPKQVVNWRPFQQALAFALAALVVFGLAGLIWPRRTYVSLQRIIAPLADIPPAANVAYQVVPGDAKLLRGDEFPITAHVAKGRPDRLRVEIRPANGGSTIGYDLAPSGTNDWRFTLTGYEKPFRYRVIGGGTWSQTHRVAVLERPNIVAVHTVLHYPDYLQPTPPVVSTAQVPDVTGPEGSQIEVVAAVQGDVSTGNVQRLEAGTNGAARVLGSLPMTRGPTNTWRGQFLLTSNGLFRVEFRNELGYANKPMTPARFVALPDRPPQVAIERPGTDVSLSPTGKLPVVVAVSDDFGLAGVSLVLGTNTVSLKQYPTNQITDSVPGTLDMAALGAKVGDTIRYRAEARDRKGQTAHSTDFFVHITAPDQSAEQNVVKLGDQQNVIVRKLTDLIAAQDSLRIKLDKLGPRYAPLLEKLAAAAQAAELRPAPETTTNATQSLQPTNLTALAKADLNAVDLNQLLGLQARLAELAQVQQQNLQQAQQFAAELRQAAELAAALPLMPLAMGEQMRVMQRAFDQMVLPPMQQLANALQQSGSPQGLPASPEQLSQYSEQLQRNMSALATNLQELAASTRQMSENPSAALQALAEARLKSQARLSARDLDYLQQQLAGMTDEMKRLQGGEEKLADQTTAADTNTLAAVARQQAALEKELGPLLDAVRDLQAQGKLRPLRRQPPTFPDEPYTPDNPEALLPPQEEDVAAPPATTHLSPAERAAQLRQQLKQRLEERQDPDEPLYMPALSTERPKLNPRFADKLRPGSKNPQLPMPFGQQQEELQSRQMHRLQDLDMAQQSVSADQQVLQAVAQQLAQALGDQGDWQGLLPALQSPNLNRALEMAARMQQMRGQSGRDQALGWLPRPGGWSMYGGGRVYMGPMPMSGRLPQLDVTARTVILNMQPKMREELLQGMQEQGPAAYQPYIRQYFEQLTKVKEQK